MKELVAAELVTEFERKLFESAVRNLQDAGNPLRFNNFAYAMRELVRHVLSRLAPDDEVRSCGWYSPETCHANGISRRQRVYYAVQGGLHDAYVKHQLGLDIGEIHRTLRDAVDNLSKHTHIEESTFDLPNQLIEGFVLDTFTAFLDLFSTIKECRRVLVSALWEHIDKSVLNAALYETILSIDELATHHWIEQVYTEEIAVIGIDATEIQFVADGSIECTLRWGSNSDMRRGDAVEMSESFPFTCNLVSSVRNPNDIVVERDSFTADTSSWWEGFRD